MLRQGNIIKVALMLVRKHLLFSVLSAQGPQWKNKSGDALQMAW